MSVLPLNGTKAEAALKQIAVQSNISFAEEEGEAAFYGPKIDFIVKDVIGREWQLGTIQVDYNLPERFDLTYIDSDNSSKRPVMHSSGPLWIPRTILWSSHRAFCRRFSALAGSRAGADTANF